MGAKPLARLLLRPSGEPQGVRRGGGVRGWTDGRKAEGEGGGSHLNSVNKVVLFRVLLLQRHGFTSQIWPLPHLSPAAAFFFVSSVFSSGAHCVGLCMGIVAGGWGWNRPAGPRRPKGGALGRARRGGRWRGARGAPLRSRLSDPHPCPCCCCCSLLCSAGFCSSQGRGWAPVCAFQSFSIIREGSAPDLPIKAKARSTPAASAATAMTPTGVAWRWSACCSRRRPVRR